MHNILKKLSNLKNYLCHVFVIQSNDNHWVKFGLLPKSFASQNENIVIKRRDVIFIALLYSCKILVSLFAGWECHSALKYSANFWSLFGSQVVWLYLSLLACFAASENVLVPILVRKYWADDWINQLDEGNIESWFESVSLSKNEMLVLKHKTKRFSKYVFWLVNCSIKVMPTIATLFFALYISKYQFSFETVVVGLLSWFLFVCTGTPFFLYNFIPFAYFVVFCYRAKLLLQLLTKDLNSIACLYDVNLNSFKTRLSQNIKCQMRLFQLIASCNRLYRHLTPCTLVFALLASVSLLYSTQQVAAFSEKLILFALLFSALVTSVTLFLVGNLISSQTKRILLAFYKLSCPNHQTERKLFFPFTARWQMLLMLEYLNSKHNRIGFSCLHWFRLNHAALLKVRRVLCKFGLLIFSFSLGFVCVLDNLFLSA